MNRGGLEPERGDDPRDERQANRDGEQPVVPPQRGWRQRGRRQPGRAGPDPRSRRPGVPGDLGRPDPEAARPFRCGGRRAAATRVAALARAEVRH